MNLVTGPQLPEFCLLWAKHSGTGTPHPLIPWQGNKQYGSIWNKMFSFWLIIGKYT